MIRYMSSNYDRYLFTKRKLIKILDESEIFISSYSALLESGKLYSYSEFKKLYEHLTRWESKREEIIQEMKRLHIRR